MCTFDIFLGEHNAVWLECVEGLDAATQRMNEIAAEKPGIYFVLNLHDDLVVAKTDTRSPARVPTREALRECLVLGENQENYPVDPAKVEKLREAALEMLVLVCEYVEPDWRGFAVARVIEAHAEAIGAMFIQELAKK